VTGVYFFADDFFCLLQIVERPFLHFLIVPFGGHVLLVRNFFFWVWYAVFGFQSEPYYEAAFVTHLVNVWLLFRVIRGFTADAALACLGATAWGTSPLCLGTLGWYAVYGHLLVATVLLVVLAQMPGHTPSFRRAVGWSLLLVAGATCFGVGIGVGAVFPLTLLLVAPEAFHDRRLAAMMAVFPLAVVGLYFGCRQLSTLVQPLPFSEMNVVRLGLSRPGPIVVMTLELLLSGVAGLVRGFAFSLADYPGSASTWAVAIYFAALVAALGTGDTALRCRLGGLLLLALGAFAIIAAGRANLLVAGGVPLVGEHHLRYYYAGLLPLAIVGCLVLHRGCAALPRPRVASGVLLAIWLAVATRAFVASGWQIDQRVGYRRFVASTLRGIDAAVDAAPAGDVQLPNRPLAPGMLEAVVPADFPGTAALFALRYRDDVVRGRRVRFVERDPRLLAAVRAGRHPLLARLLVAPTK